MLVTTERVLMHQAYLFQLRAHFTILVNGAEQPFEANFKRLMSKVDVYSKFRMARARRVIHEFVTDGKYCVCWSTIRSGHITSTTFTHS